MGAAILVLMVLVALLLIGFATYGVYLGFGLLARRISATWNELSAPEVQPAAFSVGQGSAALPIASPMVACWDVKGCSPEKRDGCPAYAHPEQPCWLAKMNATADYHLSPNCLACSLFNIPAMVAQA